MIEKFRLLLVTLMLCSIAASVCAADNKLSVDLGHGRIHEFMIELADTPDKRTIGLMFRKHLDKDAGMLFLFGGKSESDKSFWMKNTLIPLDMVFIRRDGTIHHIHANAQPHDLSPAPSKGPVFAVLEINGGRAAQLGIKPGQQIKHPVFLNPLALDKAIQ